MNVTTSTQSGRLIRQICGVLLALVGTAAILLLTFWIGQQHAADVGRYFSYQAAGLVVAAIVVVGVSLLNGRKFLRWGSLDAPSRHMKVLGVKPGESWSRVGVTFAVIISIVTGVFLALAYWDHLGSVSVNSWIIAFLLSIPLSASNALIEELITRWAVVQSLTGRSARFAPWVSALIFGSVHFFGIPGGPVGAVMAGFLAWLLARSIQDTRGIGWAWITHLCQDILIFTTTIALFL